MESAAVGERRVTGAEIIERKAGAKFLDAREHLSGMFRIFSMTSDSVSFELERAARNPRTRNHGTQIVDQVLSQELARRHIDAGENGFAIACCTLPQGELARRALQYEQSKIDDKTDLLRNGDEVGRRHPAILG